MHKRTPARLTTRGRLAAALGVLVLGFVVYLGTFVVSYGDLFRRDDPLLAMDVARLAPARVARVHAAREVEQLRAVLRDAREPDLLSINHEVDEEVIDRLIAKGWPAFIWTPDDEEDLRRAFAKRPYGVISDQPLRAKRIRDE